MPWPVVDDGRRWFCAVIDIEFDIAGIRIEGVLPQLGDGGGTVGNLLAAQMVDRARPYLECSARYHDAGLPLDSGAPVGAPQLSL